MLDLIATVYAIKTKLLDSRIPTSIFKKSDFKYFQLSAAMEEDVTDSVT